jgi:hypothetical protein
MSGTSCLSRKKWMSESIARRLGDERVAVAAILSARGRASMHARARALSTWSMFGLRA